jgi:hypothetical protein
MKIRGLKKSHSKINCTVEKVHTIFSIASPSVDPKYNKTGCEETILHGAWT